MASRALIEAALSLTAHEPLPMFHIGENIQNHIGLLNEYLDNINVSDEKDKIKFLLSSLERNAKFELFAVPNYSVSKGSYHELVDILHTLYHQKQSEIKSIVQILRYKQEDRTLREFVTFLRVKSFENWPDQEPSEREEMLVFAFVHGINDKEIATVLKKLNPKSLDEAFNLIKKESKSNAQSGESPSFMKLQEEEDVYQKVNILSEKILVLERRIQELENKDKHLEQASKSHTRREVKCFKCDKIGHFARNCKRDVKCQKCQRKGHLAKNCWLERKQHVQKFRKLTEDDVASNASSFTVQSSMNDTINEEDQSNFHLILRKKTNEQIKQKKKCYVPKEINALTQYIEGHGARPKALKNSDGKTVISSSHRELARNKPVVWGKVQNKPEKIFVDSGSENNIIDFQCLQKLIKEDSKIAFVKRSGNLCCANGSKMETKGYVYLYVKIHSIVNKLKFIVVEKIFPNIIIGITGMKLLKTKLDAEHSALEVQGKRIPFLSKVECPENRNARI